MEVIITHESADHDALAAAVAAQKLHPRARIVLGRAVSVPVRDFLALHKDRFETIRVGDLDQRAVRRVIVVDVRRAGRLRAFDVLMRRIQERDRTLEVHVYDHHAAAGDDIAGSVERVEPVGSATTLLVEHIRARRLPVDTLEATLFVLGVYADTGQLMHAATTSRDAGAVAWLLEQGASLRAVNRYLNPPFTRDQREVLAAIMGGRLEVRDVRGTPVGVAVIERSGRCEGLDIVATRALELEPVVALFLVHGEGRGRVHVIGRSRSPVVNVAAILEELGGGGHGAAAAAALKETSARDVTLRLHEAVRRHPPRARLVRDVMSSPVRWVAPELPLEAVGKMLEDWQHTGAPVLQAGELVGIVSRRDVERARSAGRLHLPVSGYMKQKVETTVSSATLEEALGQMERSDVGRLPVVDRGRLVGIITRTELLRYLYDE